MKKNIAATLALVFGLSIAGTAFAANPFADVPVKHWSYDAVQQLANDGIITGGGDGSYQGERAVSRYEMAAVVASAIAHADKANAADKALIEKLAAEYEAELEGLNVRLTKVEKKQGNIKFSGEFRERYEWTKVDPSTGTDSTAMKTRVRLNIATQMSDDVAFNARFHSESKKTNEAGDAYIDLAYLSGKLFEGVNFTAGRMVMSVGKGITCDTWHDWDGAKISFGNKVKVNVGAAKYHSTTGWDSPNYAYADLNYAFTPNFDMSLAYFTDSQDYNEYKTKAIGFSYAFNKFVLKAEYGKNGADNAKQANNGSEAKAWYGNLKYLGANAAKVHSYGAWIGYRKADKGFDPEWWSTPESSDVAGGLAALNDTKGFEYGVEYTVFKNAIFAVQYNDMKDKNGDSPDGRRNLFTSLSYSF
ncbi:MAG: S-layer protein [Firmicutes bacterium]|nr:S-layer protein [Bacillota bacterium]